MLREQIIDHLRAGLPNEGCGLLAGVVEGDRERAVHFFAGTNIDRSPVRYTMDPGEVIDAMKRMRDEDWRLAAIVHSHPRTRPTPSRTDLAEAYYPDARLLIVSFADSQPEIRCWSILVDQRSRRFQEEALESSDCLRSPWTRMFAGIHRMIRPGGMFDSTTLRCAGLALLVVAFARRFGQCGPFGALRAQHCCGAGRRGLDTLRSGAGWRSLPGMGVSGTVRSVLSRGGTTSGPQYTEAVLPAELGGDTGSRSDGA
ncbi:MAG: M67 family metallopeptidase [Thermomicrobiales bacterium]|nr:M67 family metallopeptidase [Thermomicrobiales bacterium]